MVLARGRGRSRGGIVKPKGRPVPMKPPPLMGRLAPIPPDMLRPRGVPIPPPGLMPRMRPPPPGLRSPRLLPPPPPGPRRPPMPHFVPAPHPPPPPPPPAHAFPPAVPPRPPMPMLRPRPGQRPPPPGLRPIPPLGVGPPAMGRLGRGGKRMAVPMAAKPKPKIKKVITPDDAELNKPWITESIKNEVLKKQKLYQKAKKSNAESDWKEFNEMKAKVTTIIREAKLEYIGSHPEEDNKYFCETCDRDFKNEGKLAEHMQEHRVCGLDGCQFTAHPKVVEKHVKMQHETGLYYRISNLYKPEDIAKWIAERKRNYPTKINVEKKQAAFEEKMQRGERLSEDKSRFQRNSHSFTPGFRRGSGHRGKRGGHSRKFSRPQSSETSRGHAVSKNENEREIFRWKLQPFCGTAVVQNNDAEEASVKEDDQDHHFSDSEWEAAAPVEGDSVSVSADIQIPVASKALSNLMGLYASETSDTEGDEKEVLMNKVSSSFIHKEQVSCESNNVIQNSSTSLPSTSNAPECKPENDSDGPPEETPILHSRDVDNNQPEEKKPTTQEQSKPQQHRNKFNKPMAPPPQHKSISNKVSMRRRKLTLLEKLLRSEIRHERNVILQCVRYVVQNNFLELGKPKTETNPEYTKLFKCIQHIVKNDFFGTLKQEHRNEA